MQPFPFQTFISVEPPEAARTQSDKTKESLAPAHPQTAALDLHRYGYLFPDLQTDSSNLLENSAATVDNLKRLGQTMCDRGDGKVPDSGIPAIYTYFSQFVDHDISLEAVSNDLADISDPFLTPLSLKQITQKIKNARSGTLDLDSIYDFPAPCSGEEMAVNQVSPSPYPLPKKDPYNDLPRRPRSTNIRRDREALIGEARNDENLILAQLHMAFLRAHNAIARKVSSFAQARRLLRQHYQWVVIEDFLERVADPAIVHSVKAKNRWFDPPAGQFFVPLEFTVSAYRFGHSMIRAVYNHNRNFPAARLKELFLFTAFSGHLGPGEGSTTLPSMWVIDWANFVEAGGKRNAARPINTSLAKPLFDLRDKTGQTSPIIGSLAACDLLRGYLLRIPTGQAVARRLGLPVLEPAEIDAAAANDDQRTVLHYAGFLDRTPLWFYILAEAAHERIVNKTDHLGPVGSTLVAEVLIGLIRRSEDSILQIKGWTPTLPSTSGKFVLADLLRLAGVLA